MKALVILDNAPPHLSVDFLMSHDGKISPPPKKKTNLTYSARGPRVFFLVSTCTDGSTSKNDSCFLRIKTENTIEVNKPWPDKSIQN